MLSDSESEYEGENDVQLTINEHFAKAYEYKKEREELAKLKDKYGSDAELDDGEGDSDDDDSEENETEDEDGEELTPAMDAAILRTLAKIKRKDPSIYEAGKDVFEEEQQKTRPTRTDHRTSSSKDKSKPLLMRQHVLNSTLNPTSRSPSPAPALLPTHAEEQAALRKETISAFHTAVASDNDDGKGEEGDGDDDDDLLVPREKTKDEVEREEEEYREFLAREVGEDIGKLVTVDENPFFAAEEGEGEGVASSSRNAIHEPSEKKKKKKGKDKAARKEETDHEFLMNYILNRGWIDRSDRHVPTYKEITSTKAPKVKTKKGAEIGGGGDEDDNQGDVQANNQEGLEISVEDAATAALAEADESPNEFDEDDFDDIADTFESSYNFRFEEPGASAISTHPRNIASTVRRAENPRKAARERKKERKDEKMLKKREEVKRLKALKLKALKSKLERIGKEGGLDNLDEDALAQLDLDADWDPDAHDKQMAEIYAGAEEGGEEDDTDANDDMEKPTWDDDIDITDIVGKGEGPSSSSSKKDKKKEKKKRKQIDKDDVEAVEANADPNSMDVDFTDIPEENEEENDGTAHTRQKILDAYVSQHLDTLDFTDMIGDMPTRFHYVPVDSSSYGLSATEILLADDADLNAYVGLKKIAPYRRQKQGKDGKQKSKTLGESWDPKRQEKLKELRSKLEEKRKKFGVVLDEQKSQANGEVKPKRRMGKKERLKRKLATDAAEDVVETKGDENVENKGRETSVQEQTEPGAPPKKRKRKHKSGEV